MNQRRTDWIAGLAVATWFAASAAHGGAAPDGRPTAWDIRVGPSFTGVSGELADVLDRDPGGFEVGVGLRWPRSPRLLVLQGELLFSSRTRSFQDTVHAGFSGFFDGLLLRRSLRVYYAQIPLLARASLGWTGVFRPYALGGPYVAWNLSSRIEPGEYVGDEPINPGDVRAADAGAVVGLGFEIVGAKGRFALEVRSDLGLVDVMEERADLEGKYRVLTVLIAFSPAQ